jgi:hypothetical protein
VDVAWLSAEAKTIHQIFENVFFVLITTFVVLGIVLEFLKLPIGSAPSLSQLAGRAVVAILILAALPEIMNTLAQLTDSFTKELGGLNELQHLLSRLGEKLGSMSWSWSSVKDSAMLLISLLSFTVLYVTVYVSDAIFLYSWLLLYIFSPLLISLFVLPQTASATKMLFKSLVEVCAWKVLWCVMASLLWSVALSDINKDAHEISFLTAIVLNVMLIFSLVMIPKITSAFMSSGISGVASGIGSSIVTTASRIPANFIKKPDGDGEKSKPSAIERKI